MAEAHIDEVALMAGVAAERMPSFEALYRLYHPRLSRFLMRMLRQHALVEEVLDDTMLVVWRRAHAFLPTAKVSTWIFGIAYRQALKALRDGGTAAEMQSFDPDAHDAEDHGADPLLAVEQAWQRREIDELLARLSAEHRAVIEMTYLLGFGCRDIAEVMGCPVDTVKTRMFHARKKLRAMLEARGVEAR